MCIRDSRYIGVNQRDLQTVYDADCVDSSFSIVKPVIHPLKRRPFENPDRIPRRRSVTRNIPPTLSFVPNVVDRFIFTLCIDTRVGPTGDRIARTARLLRSRNGARPYPSGPAGQILPDGVVFSRRIWPEVLLQQQRPVKCSGRVRDCIRRRGPVFPPPFPGPAIHGKKPFSNQRSGLDQCTSGA